MLTNMIAVVKNVLVRRARSVACVVKRFVGPAQSVAAATAGAASDAVRSRSSLLAENALLRQQVIILRRSVKRPALGRADRVIMVLLAGLSQTWRDTLHLVQPDTLLRWHREIFKIVWRRKSKPKGQPKRLAPQTIDLIKEMAVSNATWGPRGSAASF